MSEKEVLQTLLEAANGKITDLTAEVTNLASKLADAQEERVSLDDLAKLLPGTYYMNPPDGGDVHVMEQLRRMAEDADKFRAAIAAPVVQVAGGEPRKILGRDCDLLTMAQVKAICDAIKPGDGWDGDNWDFALANAVAAKVSARAADAPSEPSEFPTCRDDGRCQYAIDHGAEGMGHCPTGKCCMPNSESSESLDAARYRALRSGNDYSVEGAPMVVLYEKTSDSDDRPFWSLSGEALDNLTDVKLSGRAADALDSQPTDGEVRNG